MNTEIENYLNHKKISKFNPKVQKYLSNLLSKFLLSIIFLMVSIILIKSNSNIKTFYQEDILTKQINFTKFNDFYTKYFGNILPDYTVPSAPTQMASNTEFDYNNGTPYLNGTKLETTENYPVPIITSGIIVFLGEKDSLGPTCIVQGIDGVDIWYSHIDTSSLNLYDYVTEGKILAPTESNYFYLTIDSNGNYLTYDTYKS
ncbi:MAG: peptidoglycan DD-metalloendopeptidase family protein [Bacilli bacterium]|nr:peptidoglycan DD-metalloendopeptidase family protein [Bacilli bacterium]